MTTTLTLAQLIAQRKSQFNRLRPIRPNPGRNRYRILPGWRKNADGTPSGDPTFYHDFGQHWIKDATGQVKAVYTCADKTFGRPCEVCDAIAQGIKLATDDATKKIMEEAKASARVLLNVLHLDGPTPNEPQILEVAPSVFNGKKGVGGILSLFEEWPNLIDPVNGNDIIIEKSGAGLDTSYGVSIAGSSKPVPVEALKKLHDLDKYVQQESEAAAARALASLSAAAGTPLLTGPAMGTTHVMPGAEWVSPATPVAAAPATVLPSTEDVLAAVEAAEAAPAPVAAPVAPAPAAAAPVMASSGDDDLDALLRDLDA